MSEINDQEHKDKFILTISSHVYDIDFRVYNDENEVYQLIHHTIDIKCFDQIYFE